MTSLHTYRAEWLGNIRGDLLSGLVVALALIPEAIAFSIIAGVDPKVGLYASFSIAVVTAIAGGRPGMISAATAATAVLMVCPIAARPRLARAGDVAAWRGSALRDFNPTPGRPQRCRGKASDRVSLRADRARRAIRRRAG